MIRGYVPLLLVVAGIWGASYLFIKVAVDEIEPTAMMELRLILAALVLVPFVVLRLGKARALAELRGTGSGAWVLGAANMAIPFTLIAWGEKHVDSGIAAIANASVPIFVVALAVKYRPSERVTGVRLAGVLLGFAGVGVLTGLHPEGGWWAIAGTLAVVVASFSYAVSNLYTQHRFPATSPLVITAASSVAAAILLLPFALLQLPGEVPSWQALGSVAALGLGGTAVALIFFYRMLVSYGAARASLVTYLLPPFALVYGVFFLAEEIAVNAALGLVLILAGVAVGSGVLRGARREPAPATQRP
ncbi:MAG TPA: DMT family transporter [Gaiellaceae bacterium]|nr:DMT family transporter [Gaiellaceae bacterium]